MQIFTCPIIMLISFIFICLLILVYLSGAFFPFEVRRPAIYVQNNLMLGNITGFFPSVANIHLFWWKALFTGVLYFLFSLILFFALTYEKPKPRALEWLQVLGGSLILVVTSELIQALFKQRYFDFFQIESGLIGAALGVSLAAMIQSSAKEFQKIPLIAAFVSITVLILIEWLKPFQFDFSVIHLKEKIEKLEWLPFRHYSIRRFSGWDLEDLLRKITLLSAWGGLATYWFWNLTAESKIRPLLGGLAAVSMILILEALQLPVLSRHLSATDPAIGFLAGGFGGIILVLIFKIKNLNFINDCPA